MLRSHSRYFARLGSLEGHGKDMYTLTFSPDGRFLLGGGADCQVVLWEVEKHRVSQSLPAISSPITASCWVTNLGDHISAVAGFIIGCADGTVVLYLRKGKEMSFELTLVVMIGGPVEDLDYQPNHGKLAAVGGGDIAIWTLFCTSNMYASLVTQQTCSIRKMGDIVTNVHFIAKDTVIVSFLESGDLSAYSINPFACIWSHTTKPRIGRLAVSTKADMIAVCSIAQGIGLYSLPRLSQTQTIHHPFFREGVIVDAEFTQSDSLLVVGSDHGRVYIYDVFTGTLVMALPHTSPDKSVQLVAVHSGLKITIASYSLMAKSSADPIHCKPPSGKSEERSGVALWRSDGEALPVTMKPSAKMVSLHMVITIAIIFTLLNWLVHKNI